MSGIRPVLAYARVGRRAVLLGGVPLSRGAWRARCVAACAVQCGWGLCAALQLLRVLRRASKISTVLLGHE